MADHPGSHSLRNLITYGESQTRYPMLALIEPIEDGFVFFLRYPVPIIIDMNTPIGLFK
ncbi:hypothetical protein D3C72_2408580 [compost metagenome]